MAYYLKMEILSDWSSNYTQFSEIEFYNNTTKIDINQLSIVEGSNTINPASYGLGKAIDGDTTVNFVSMVTSGYPRYLIIKSNQSFNKVKHYGDLQNIYGIKDIDYHILQSDTDPSRNDVSWEKVVTTSYPNINYIVEHNLITKKYLIKQNENYYTIKTTNYDSITSHNFTLLDLTGGTTPNVSDIETFGFDDISVLTNSMTVGSDTFIPVSKFDNTAELKLYKPI